MAELEPPTQVVAVNRWPLVLAVLAFVSFVFYLLQPILLPFVLGGLIAYLGDPLVDWLEQHKLNRTVAVSLVFLLLTAIIIAAALIFLPFGTSGSSAIFSGAKSALDCSSATKVSSISDTGSNALSVFSLNHSLADNPILSVSSARLIATSVLYSVSNLFINSLFIFQHNTNRSQDVSMT